MYEASEIYTLFTVSFLLCILLKSQRTSAKDHPLLPSPLLFLDDVVRKALENRRSSNDEIIYPIVFGFLNAVVPFNLHALRYVLLADFGRSEAATTAMMQFSNYDTNIQIKT